MPPLDHSPLVYENIQQLSVTQEEYFGIDAISRSDMKRFMEHPTKYKYHEDEDKPAFAFGTAFEVLLLEPENFENKVAVLPDSVPQPSTDMQIKLAKELRYESDISIAAQNAGYKRLDKNTAKNMLAYSDFMRRSGDKTIITKEARDRMRLMLQSVRNCRLAMDVIKKSEQQVVYVATHAPTGLRVKGMIDLLQSDAGTKRVVDLKTTSYSLDGFRDTVGKWGYDYQLAHYCALAGTKHNGIIFVEKEKPFEVLLATLPEKNLVARQREINEILFSMKKSMDEYDYEQRSSFNTWVTI